MLLLTPMGKKHQFFHLSEHKVQFSAPSCLSKGYIITVCHACHHSCIPITPNLHPPFFFLSKFKSLLILLNMDTNTDLSQMNRIQSAPLQINNAWWQCQVSQANSDYSECLWRPTQEMTDWRIQPYSWNMAGEVNVVDDDDDDMESDESEVEFDLEDFEGVPSIS